MAKGPFETRLGMLRAELTPVSTFVEVGGEGRFARALESLVRDSISVGPGAPGQEGGVRYVYSDGFDVPVAANSADLVYSAVGLAHLDRQQLGTHLMDIHRVLKTDGHFICVTPPVPDERTLAHFLRKAGFRDVKLALGRRVRLPVWLAKAAEGLGGALGRRERPAEVVLVATK